MFEIVKREYIRLVEPRVQHDGPAGCWPGVFGKQKSGMRNLPGWSFF